MHPSLRFVAPTLSSGLRLRHACLVLSLAWAHTLAAQAPCSLSSTFSVVIGKPNFNTATPVAGNPTTTGGIAYDGNGYLYVADPQNHRVLVYNNLPLSGADTSPVAVLGQSNFTDTSMVTPVGPGSFSQLGNLAVSPDNQWLFVADTALNRVLGFHLPASNGEAATLVLGQPNFTASTAGSASNQMNTPFSVATDATNLYVGDSTRILVFPLGSLTSSMAAPLIIKQNAGSQAWSGSKSMSSDGTTLAVVVDADRVVLYQPIPTGTGTVMVDPKVVVGQNRNLVGSNPYTSIDRTFYPDGVLLFGGHLLINDGGNHRVLVYYNLPTLDAAPADFVIGQPDFKSSAANQGAGAPNNYSLSNMGNPVNELATDGTSLYIADQANGRVVKVDCLAGLTAPPTPVYLSPVGPSPSWTPTPCSMSNGEAFGLVVGQKDFVSAGLAATDKKGGLTTPRSVAYAGNRLFVADHGASRVLVYENLPAGGSLTTPVAVIGQPDFVQNWQRGVSAYSLAYPQGLAVSPDNHYLFVSQNLDSGYFGRISIYDLTKLPATGAVPVGVIGQADFSAYYYPTTCSATTLAVPEGLAVTDNMLWVADTGNYRVLGYSLSALSLPFGTSASIVIGQSTMTANSPRSASNTSLTPPHAIASDGSHFAVTDSQRVLLWDSIPTANNQPATGVVGQPSFTSSNSPTPNSTSIASSRAVLLANGHLAVCDETYSRVLIWNNWPTILGQAADLVMGQANFAGTARNAGLGSTNAQGFSFNTAAGLATDGNRIFVTDIGNNRVVALGCWQGPPVTATMTSTVTPTPTWSSTTTATPTWSSSPTPSVTRTVSPSPSASPTPSATRTASPSPSASPTPSVTRTVSPSPSVSPTPSATPTSSPTRTASGTASVSPTVTRTPTVTPTRSQTTSVTPTPTATRSGTPTATRTRTGTFTFSPTLTRTGTLTATRTWTGTFTFSPTLTCTGTPTTTRTRTGTFTFSPTITPTGTYTATRTFTSTYTPSRTPTPTTTASPSGTKSATLTGTPSSTPTWSPTVTATATYSVTSSNTLTSTPSGTFSNTPTTTPPGTATVSPTQTPCIACSGGSYSVNGFYGFNDGTLAVAQGSGWGPGNWAPTPGGEVIIDDGSNMSLSGFTGGGALALDASTVTLGSTYIGVWYQVYSGATETSTAMTLLDFQTRGYSIQLFLHGPADPLSGHLTGTYSTASGSSSFDINIGYEYGPYNATHPGRASGFGVGRHSLGVELAPCGLRIYVDPVGADDTGSGAYDYTDFGSNAGNTGSWMYFGNDHTFSTPVDGYIDDVWGYGCGGNSGVRVLPMKSPALSAALQAVKTLALAPNPAKGQALAAVRLPQAGDLRLTVYDLNGRALLHRDQGLRPQGIDQYPLDLSGLADGLYFLGAELDPGSGGRNLGLFKFAVLH